MLAPDLGRAESLARLDTVRLAIGPATLRVLDAEGKPIGAMTAEAARVVQGGYLKAHVEAHFVV